MTNTPTTESNTAPTRLKKIMSIFAISEEAAVVIYNISNVAVVISALVAGVGAVLLFWAGGWKDWYANKELAQLKTEAAKANEGLAVANLQIEDRKKENLELSLQLEALKNWQKPRHLTAEERSKLVNLLRAETGSISVAPVMASDDAKGFADELRAAFTDAGWDATGENTVVIPSRDFFGIKLSIRSVAEAPPFLKTAAFSLEDALGVTVPVSPNENKKPGELQLEVGRKPTPEELKTILRSK
jgi:hypothetical protein